MSPQEQTALQQIVVAGMKVMYDKATFPMLESQIKKDIPMADKLANGAAGLMRLLQDKANGGIPRQLLIPATGMLMLEIGKFMADAGMPAPTPEDVKAAYEKLAPLMAKEFPKVTPRTQPAAQPAEKPAAQPKAQPAARPAMPMQRGLIGAM